jgi:general secretion pathway protein M
MNSYLNALSRRQRTALIAGGGAIILLLVIQGFIVPFFASWRATQQAIRNNEQILADVFVYSNEYRELKRKMEKIQQVLTRRTQDFNLFSYLERMAGSAGLKSSIKSISASKGSITGPYEEVPVEIRLEKITLKQLTDFLYLIESPQDMIRIRNIAVAKMKESPEYLSAQALVVTYQLTKVAQR